MFHSKLVSHFQKQQKRQNDSNTENEVYKPYLIKPISFKDSVNYVSDREFTIEELAQITSETIV